MFTDDGVWDGIGTVLIGILLVCVAIVLALETKSLLLGESATREHIDAIESALLQGDDVDRVIHLRTQHVGPDELLIGAKIAVGSDSLVSDVALTINAAEARIRAAVPIAKYIYLEPDIDRAAVAAALRTPVAERAPGLP